MTLPGHLRWMAENTPADRNRVVDVVRAFALGVVVFGHWMKQGIHVDADGVLHRAGLLGQAPWTHPLTWLLQVMPLFFLVGGYANAKSWRHALELGHSYGWWLRGRVSRLTRPLLPLLGFWVLVASLSHPLGLDERWLYAGSDTAFVPTWFLANYLVIVAIVPLTHRAWARWGSVTVVAGLVAAAVVDLVSILTARDVLGSLNLVFVWGSLHQLGYLWLDRRAPGRKLTAGLGFGCLVGLVLLVWWGPYGVSMVGVSGFGLNNTNPPRLTLLLLGGAQVAGVLLLEPVLARLATSARIWQLVVAVEARTMTIYLWHMTVLAVLAAGSLQLGGLGLHALPASVDWWRQRPIWFVLLALTTAIVVYIVGSWEDPIRRTYVRTGAMLPLTEVAVTCGALTLMAMHALGPTDGGDPRWPFALATLLALLLLRRLDSRVSDVTLPLHRERT